MFIAYRSRWESVQELHGHIRSYPDALVFFVNFGSFVGFIFCIPNPDLYFVINLNNTAIIDFRFDFSCSVVLS